jgi:hypothetical protein
MIKWRPRYLWNLKESRIPVLLYVSLSFCIQFDRSTDISFPLLLACRNLDMSSIVSSVSSVVVTVRKGGDQFELTLISCAILMIKILDFLP